MYNYRKITQLSSLVIICVFFVLLMSCNSESEKINSPSNLSENNLGGNSTNNNTTINRPYESTSALLSNNMQQPNETELNAYESVTRETNSLGKADSISHIPLLGLGKYTVSSEPVKIDCERFIINIEKNVVYSTELPIFIKEVMERLEKETGLLFYPNWGQLSKVLINVVPSDSNSAYSSEQGITVAPMDMFIDGGMCAYVFVHELSHALLMRNCEMNSKAFHESFAVININKIDKFTNKPSIFSCYFNYSHFENESEMLEDPEEYFRKVSGWDAYLFGFRLAVYLEATYGSNIYPDIIREAGEKYRNVSVTPLEVLDIIKSKTSTKVFGDFKKWYEVNKFIFDISSYTINLQKYDSIDVYPVYNDNFKNYPKLDFNYLNNICFDFKGGFGYLQQQGYNVYGIYGTVSSKGKHILSFYNVADELICTKTLENTSISLDVINAVKMVFYKYCKKIK